MAKEPRILAEETVDEVPRTAPPRPTKYQHHVDDVLDTGKAKRLVCKDSKSAFAVYTGIKRAIKRTGAEVKVKTVTEPDDTVSVYVEPRARTKTSTTSKTA